MQYEAYQHKNMGQQRTQEMSYGGYPGLMAGNGYNTPNWNMQPPHFQAAQRMQPMIQYPWAPFQISQNAAVSNHTTQQFNMNTNYMAPMAPLPPVPEVNPIRQRVPSASKYDPQYNDTIIYKQTGSREQRVRIRAPEPWRKFKREITTPTEIREQMGTVERNSTFVQNIFSNKESRPNLQYQPYTQEDYEIFKFKDATRKLPRGLGPAEDETWLLEVN